MVVSIGRRVDLVHVVDQGMGDREHGARTLRGLDELLDGHARLGDVGGAVGAEPVDEEPVPGVVVLLADDLGMQVDHRAREVRASDRVHVARHLGQVREGQVLEALRPGGASTSSWLRTSRSWRSDASCLLERVFGIQRQEVGEHVDVARRRAPSRSSGTHCRAARPRHRSRASIPRRLPPRPSPRDSSVVSWSVREIARSAQIACLFGQLRRRVRTVGERRVGMEIEHPK